MAKKIRKNKKSLRSIISVVIAVLLVGAISYIGIKTYQDSHAATSPAIYVNPGSGTLTAGSNVSVTLRENSGTDPVNTVQVSINYDSNQLQYTSIVEGGKFPTVAATNTSTPGVVRVARATDTPVTGDNAVVTVNFKVIGTSGTGTITVDKAFSMLVSSTSNTDILESTGNGSYTFQGVVTPPAPSPSPNPTPTPPPPSSNTKPVFYIDPSGGSYGKDATIAAKIHLNSYATATTTVEAVINYPADKLQYVSTSEGGVYPTQQRTKTGTGSVDIIRAISGGGGGINGDNVVVTVNFKVIGDSGTANVSFAGSSAVYDTSGTGTNVLNLSGSAGAAYTIVGKGQGTGPTTGSNNGNGKGGGTKTVTPPSQAVSISGGHVALADTGTGTIAQVGGTVNLAPANTMAADGSTGIEKVEYYLDKKLVATEKVAPYTYNMDTTKLRNGEYTVTVKTYFDNGTVDTRTDKLSVHNKVDLTYVVRQYGTSVGLLAAILVVCAILIFKLILPRFSFARHNAFTPSVDHDIVSGFSDPSKAGPVMDDPVVVAPSSSSTTVPEASAETVSSASAPSVQVDQAAQTTPVLPVEPVEPATPAAPDSAAPVQPHPSTPINVSTPEDSQEPQVIKPTENKPE
jgi:hypothetical protein